MSWINYIACFLSRKLFLERIALGQVILELPDGRKLFFGDSSQGKVTVTIHKWNFFRRIILKETIGFAESYMDGEWDCDDLATLVLIIINNVKSGTTFGFPGKELLLRMAALRNNVSRSLSNVQIHYDLGNEFYELMLDKSTMSYTCALFRDPNDRIFSQFSEASPVTKFSLDEAQMNKIHYVIDKAQIKKENHVLELGCGWGGFAIEASKLTSCSVDAYNLSIEQVSYARKKSESLGVSNRVKFIHSDYRQSSGLYDTIVSIGMLEHVGHEDLPTFFQHCERLLKPNGVLVIHAITSPDFDYHISRFTYGFIQKYIFPGSCIPSVEAIIKAMATTHFEVQHMENIGQHYALTLRKWREQFYSNINEVFRLGYSYQFVRMWDMYLCNCEAEFIAGHLGLCQLILRRPSSVDTDIAVSKILPPLKSLCNAENVERVRHRQAVIKVQFTLQGRDFEIKEVKPKSASSNALANLLRVTAITAANFCSARYYHHSVWRSGVSTVVVMMFLSRWYPMIAKKVHGLLHEFRANSSEPSTQNTRGTLQICKSTTSNLFRVQRIRAKPSSKGKLWLGEMNRVILVNAKEGYADVQGCTTFEEFVRVTSRYKFIPLVVPELKSITVGGAIVGLGIESSSFRYGFVHEGMLKAEVLLASGEVIACSPTENSDLFEALPNSHGSLGYLLSVRMRIRPMKTYVRINKVYYPSVELLCQTIMGITSRNVESPVQKERSHPTVTFAPEVTRKDDGKVDFIEAVCFGENKGGMLMLGTMMDQLPAETTASCYRTSNRFYETLYKEGYDFLTTVDYLWRWDTDWFWVSQIFPGLKTPFFRRLLGERYLRSDVYKKFNDLVIATLGQPKDQELVIQDYEIPAQVCAEWIHAHFSIVPKGKIFITAPDGSQQRPMWLCPIRGAKHALFPMKPNQLYINCGFWDAVTVPKNVSESVNVALEKQCQRLDGLKTLYSSVHYSPQEFREIFNGDHYDKVKEKYDPDHRIADLYSKVTK